MRIVLLSALLVLTAPFIAFADDHALTTAAFNAVSEQLLWHKHPDLDGLSKENYAISDMPIAPVTSSLATWVRKKFSDTISDEIIASASTKPSADDGKPRKFTATEVDKMRVLPLTKYETQYGSYDFQRLNADYPNVRAVIRISPPALDKLNTFAVVRYEVVTSKGLAWAEYQFFELRNDTWRWTESVVGRL